MSLSTEAGPNSVGLRAEPSSLGQGLEPGPATLVMLVEDERIVALHLSQQLTKLGYQVVSVASGQQALDKVKELHPDVVLMDIHIEGDIDGIQTAALIPKELEVPVVFLTAYSEEATLARARATRPYGYLVKPFAARELHATIQMTLERRSAYIALHASEQRLRLALEAAEEVAKELVSANTHLQTEIVERRRIEREREALITDLERKNAEMERFCYTISHDLKAPLVTICGFADLAQQDTVKGDLQAVKEDVEEIARAAHALQGMLDDLLDLSSSGSIVNANQNISLYDLVKHVIDLLKGPIVNNDIEINIANNMPEVFGDYHRLLVVFQNLIENAIKYKNDQTKSSIEIQAKRVDDEVICSVRDNGRGIDPRYHERVFGLFVRLQTGSSGGKGIGLALVKRIVEAHGGRIWLESEGEGKGCTFSFSLPAERPPAH